LVETGKRSVLPVPAAARRLLSFPEFEDFLGAKVFPLVEKSSWLGAAFWLLIAVHGASALAAVAVALVARHRGPTAVKLLTILVLGMVSQILLVGAQSWVNLEPHTEGPLPGYLVPSLVFIAWLALWSRQQARDSYLLARRDHSHLTLDGLSSVLNRTSWWSLSEECWRRAKDSGAPAAVIMVDIDWFKRINDTQGHDVGDQVIRAVAQVILERTREADLEGRLGGEEFGVFLPGADHDAAVQAAERIWSDESSAR